MKMTTFGKSVDFDNRLTAPANDKKTSDISAGDNGECMKLPQTFVVKYLGNEEASGLWGIKNTRKPVDHMVEMAKKLKVGTCLPFLQLKISEKGVLVTEMPQNTNKNFSGGFYNIDSISYGVQDLVYTRVFAMIVVNADRQQMVQNKDCQPFQCHAFVCESRTVARKLTLALAAAFHAFSKYMQIHGHSNPTNTKRFAIDLRTPEEIEASENGRGIDASEA